MDRSHVALMAVGDKHEGYRELQTVEILRLVDELRTRYPHGPAFAWNDVGQNPVTVVDAIGRMDIDENAPIEVVVAASMLLGFFMGIQAHDE
jgi:hypothetical protein